ncbi:hypothetical protein AAFF_G00076560 [Aldrovandia affinis]|uniref:Mitogen-activated protein kinase 8 interacting protein 2 n=1 Tax=Aldrovandia affinis TaxID=143900 RepID=A0AAD7WCS3_9TELE|nr:hypothetical protein AAFF_G00076560 [Aldrovandia affinis]
MADRAEMFSLSTFHSLSPPGCRPAHDISLEEFDDEDLSEITDDCGIGLNYDSDPYEKDCLILEKSEVHHPVCSFQDDFQEFEMIDDDDEDDNEDGEEDAETPPSTSVSPPLSLTLGLGQKTRPTSLNLTAAVSQDSLNNNSSLSPQTASWQESLRNPSSHGRLSPAHSCLEDVDHGNSQCVAAPGPGSQCKGTPPKQPRDTGHTRSPLKPLLYDLEGNRREKPEYGSFGQHKTSSGTGAGLEPGTEHTGPVATVPAIEEPSQCSDTEVDHDLNSDSAKKCQSAQANNTYTVTSESAVDPELENDVTSNCLSTAPVGGDAGTPLSDEEDFDKEFDDMCKESYNPVCNGTECSSYVEFPPIEHCELASFSSYVSSSSRSDELGGAHSEANLGSQGHPSAASHDTTSPSSDPGIADMNSKGGRRYATSDLNSDDLCSPGSDSDIEGEIEAAFACGGPIVSHMISSISETELDLTSDESSSGRSSHLTNSIEEASSPNSDQERELELELEQESGIIAVKASLLLSQPDPIKDEASPTVPSHSEVSLDLLDDGQDLRGLQNVEGVAYGHAADPDETLPPAARCEDGLSRPLVLKIEPDHSLESFKRSFYLPVGPKLLPALDDSECDSESESEDDLSENSDSPWLLSNLVNKMISEGSYPISCPEDCFKRSHSIADTISPSSDLETDAFNDSLDGHLETVEDDALNRDVQGDDSMDMSEVRGLRMRGDGMEAPATTDRRMSSGYEADAAEINPRSNPCLYLRNPTNDTIIPVFMDQYDTRTVNQATSESDSEQTCVIDLKNLRQYEVEPNNDLSMETNRLESPCLSESVASDKDDGREQKAEMSAVDRITEMKNSLTLDIPTAQTNRCFSLTYSTENEEDSLYPFGEDYLDSCPPVDESVVNLPTADTMRARQLDESLAYDSVKYTLVVDENTTLELVSLKRCTSVLSDDSEISTLCDDGRLELDDEFGRGGAQLEDELVSSSEDSSPEADTQFSKKFLNVFVNSTSRSSSTESFGLFSCTINGEERDQTHRAVFRFIPRHTDELELDVDDPLFVEEEEDDYWYRGYNMRTGEWGIFPAYYAHEVVGQVKEFVGLKRNTAWLESFSMQFLGSVEVPYHQGNGILCAAMQKIAIARKQTVHLRPAALCDLEISLQGVKLVMSLDDNFGSMDEFDRCSHFFQMKNISFCGCHPKNNCYFGFITKHPMLNRFACHVFVSQESMRRVAECVGRAFQEYYHEHLEYACPTEDIYLE